MNNRAPSRSSHRPHGLIASMGIAAALILSPSMLQAQGYQAAEWTKIVAAANKEGRVVV